MGVLVPWAKVGDGGPGEAGQGHLVPVRQGKMTAPAYLSIFQQFHVCL